MSNLRKATDEFPYEKKTVCYVEVSGDGSVRTPRGVIERRDMVSRALLKETKIYAVWPGEWSSDLFEIDPEEMAIALKMKQKKRDMPTGDLVKKLYLIQGPPRKYDEVIANIDTRPYLRVVERGPYHMLVEVNQTEDYCFWRDGVFDVGGGSWRNRPISAETRPSQVEMEPLATYRTKKLDAIVEKQGGYLVSFL